MSECVVRMEMPNGCHDCKLRNMVGNCPIPIFDGQDEKKIWTLEECFQRPPWCPIICALPEGHGRLVDADDFIKHLFTEWSNGEISNSEWCDIRQWMNEETAIVPVEAERSKTCLD